MGTVMSRSDIERLADAIMAEWLDSQSDSGAIWEKSHRELKVLKSEASEEGIEEAYAIARARWEKVGKG
jgi:predicted 2-oxoglutarate/Fe(II)-dependent dioxygenase YbiX